MTKPRAQRHASDGSPAGPETESVWDFVPWSEIVVPRTVSQESVRRGIGAFVRRLFPSDPPAQPDEPPALDAVDPASAERIAPSVPAPTMAAALDRALGSADRCSVVLFPVHSGCEAVATDLARLRHWDVVEVRRADAIRDGGRACLERIDSLAGRPLVVDNLAHLFARAAGQLDVMRRLIERLALREEPTVVACGDWCWTWLCQVLGAGALFPPAQALARIDQDRFARWVSGAASPAPTLVLQDSPRSVVLASHSGWKTLPLDLPQSRFAANMIAEARGIPGVAAAIWRASLGLWPQSSDASPLPASVAGVKSFWVRSWDRVELPALTAPTTDELLLLHALLLHDGIDRQELDLVLPQVRAASVATALGRRRIVATDGDRIRVAPLAYPAVRRRLVEAGLLVDAESGP